MIRLSFVKKIYKRPYIKRFFWSEVIANTPSVIPAVSYSIHQFQSISGLPWWATFTTTTLLVRTMMLPLVGQQIVENSKLARAFPHLSELNKLCQLQLRQKHTSLHHKNDILLAFYKGIQAAIQHYEIKLHRIIAMPLLNVSLFFTFVYTLRQIISQHPGEPFPFSDVISVVDGMTLEDPSFSLAIIAVGLTYTALELSFGSYNGTCNYDSDCHCAAAELVIYIYLYYYTLYIY